MVDIVVYFESIHHAAAHAEHCAACASAASTGAIDAACIGDMAAAACAGAASTGAIDAASTGAIDAASIGDVAVAAASAMEELRLRYQQGLDLLLNAADLEQPCMAIFNEYDPITAEDLEEALGPSLLKKFKQLELYEVPCFVCVVNPNAVDTQVAEDVVETQETEGVMECQYASEATSAEHPAANGDTLQSATAKVFEFVQTVGFDREFELLQEANVKTFTM